jgi:hypothetical protein
MNRRERAEATYDTMPDAVAERVYRDPLARQLAAAEGQANLMTRLIGDARQNMRGNMSKDDIAGLEEAIAGYEEHRDKLNANAAQLQVLIDLRDAQLGLSAAQ